MKSELREILLTTLSEDIEHNWYRNGKGEVVYPSIEKAISEISSLYISKKRVLEIVDEIWKYASYEGKSVKCVFREEFKKKIEEIL